MIQLYQDNKLNMDTKEYIKESNIKKIIILLEEKNQYLKNIEKELRKVRLRRI